MTVRFYSSTSPEKALVGSITSGQTTLQVSNTVGLPTSFPYTLAVDYEGPTEELVEVTSAAGPVLTITRGIDGTSAASHADNARVRHTSSARDFADSRNHENSSTNIHGLTGGEEIVGTQKVQTLTNKTVVDLTGTLRNIEVTNASPHATTFTNTPAYAGATDAMEMVNGSEQVIAWKGNGNTVIRNRVIDDAAFTTRRMQVVMSDGTTERFYLDAGGMAVSIPKAGGGVADGGFKVIEPGDTSLRKVIFVRDSADAVDRFVVYAGGHVDVVNSEPANVVFDITGAAAQSSPYWRVLDSTSAVQVQVGTSGILEVRKKSFVTNDLLPADVVSTVRGTAAQTGNLEQWQNNAGVAVARVTAAGAADFTPVVTTTGIFTAAAGWSVTSQVAVVKAGVATINLALLRTGATIPADTGGDLFGDPALGTLTAAFRPHSAFAPSVLTGAASNGLGTGSWFLNASTGDMNLQTWSTGNEVLSGINLRVTMTFPLEFA
jgi:hypothetical protein